MIRKVRVIWQVFFLVLFFVLLYLATQLRMGGWPVGLFARSDPLIGISTTLAASRAPTWARLACAAVLLAAVLLAWRGGPRRRLRRWAAAILAILAGGWYLRSAGIDFHRPLALGLVVVIAAIFLGRVFCGWVCPFGTLHHFLGWLGAIGRGRRQRAEANRYRPWFALKYLVLVATLVAALFGVQQAGLADPIALLTRSATATLLPADDAAGIALFGEAAKDWTWFPQEHVTVGAWLLAVVFAGLLLANLWIPRFFCRALCPLGALLGLLGRFSLFRFRRIAGRCTDCGACDAACAGAAEPAGRLRISECVVCFNCSDACPTGAVGFAPAGVSGAEQPAAPDLSRRGLIAAAVGGLLAWPFGRLASAARARPAPRGVRPPGALPEADFLAACVKCQACGRACPTNVIQPAIAQAGWEGLWTPVMDFRIGYCEYNCIACGQACPTGAIRMLTLGEKQGRGEHEAAGPVRVGTAFVDRGRCLPWSTGRPCIVCQEVCPVSPKAIYLEEAEVDRRGEPVTVARPWVDPTRCVGCGVCSNKCPVADEPAIYVTAINATRDKEHRLML